MPADVLLPNQYTKHYIHCVFIPCCPFSKRQRMPEANAPAAKITQICRYMKSRSATGAIIMLGQEICLISN